MEKRPHVRDAATLPRQVIELKWPASLTHPAHLGYLSPAATGSSRPSHERAAGWCKAASWVELAREPRW